MENATKALLIAAGVMLSLMILSLLLIGYNQISSYYADKENITHAKQLSEFNSVYENYNRNKIRGSDLISLMNRIIDYNSQNVYEEGTGYKRIEVTISIGDIIWKKNFQYSEIDTSIVTLTNGNITNVTGNNNTADRQLTAITGIETKLINTSGIARLTSDKLQKLSSNISNIMNDGSEYAIKRELLIKNILGRDIGTITTSDMNKIKEIARQYYQYMQFKRAYFECTNFEYDGETGRVCQMDFKVTIDSNGLVVFN